MKILIFNGALERRPQATSHKLVRCLEDILEEHGVETSVFQLADSGIPIFDLSLSEIPFSVEIMVSQFQNADAHIWLTPLYHGGMTGAMKNCLDWLEVTANGHMPYLTDKTVGLVCWADGAHALQGINAMDAVAKALRAWTLPFSVPIIRSGLLKANNNAIATEYRNKLELLVSLITKKQVVSV